MQLSPSYPIIQQIQLLETGMDIRYIQSLPGHSPGPATQICAHATVFYAAWPVYLSWSTGAASVLPAQASAFFSAFSSASLVSGLKSTAWAPIP